MMEEKKMGAETEIVPERTTTTGNSSLADSSPARSDVSSTMKEKEPPKSGFFTKFKRRKSKSNNNNDTEKSSLSDKGKDDKKIDPFADLSVQDAHVLREQVDTVQKNYTYKDLYRYSTHFDRFLLLLGVICSIIAGALLPIMTVIVGTMAKIFAGYFAGLGATTEAEFQHSVDKNALYFFLLGIGVILFTYLSTVIHIDRGEVLTGRIRTRYLRSILRQNIGFFDKLGPGEVTTHISSDTNLIQDGISEKVGLIFTAVASFFSAFIIAFIMNWRLTLILSGTVVSIVGLMGGATSFVVKYTRKNIAAYGQGGSVAEEVLSSVRNVQAFGVEESSLERYDYHLKIAEKWGRKTQNAIGVMVSFLWTFIYWTYALAFWQGSRYIVSGRADVQDVIAVLFAIIIGSFALGQAAPHFQAIASATAAGQKILSTIDRVPPIDSYSDQGLTLPNLEGDIELQHVRFIYPSRPDALILKDLSLKVPKGNIVALVGASGSGKSTIVGILERFYLPLAGKVLIDGHDINELNIKWLRSQIALVSQEPTLFACSVYENIAHGLIGSPFESEPEEKKRERVIEACKEANAYDFIQALPEGLETSVGDRGFLMSGGQKQRIAIARAIVSQPKILLLDEATSALDTKSEGLVQEALDRASKNRTTIVIAHRLSTIKDADKIVVMSGGEIIEQGKHQELIDKRGHYYKLVEAQQIRLKGGPTTHVASSNASVDNSVTQIANDDEVHAYHTQEKENVLQITRTNRSVASRQEMSQYDMNPRYSVFHLIHRIFLLTKGSYGLLFFGVALSVINGFGYPVLAVLFGECMSVFGLPPTEYGKMRNRINLFSGMFFMLGCVEYIAYQLMFLSFSRVGESLVRSVRYLSLKAMLRQDVEFFDRDENSVGSLTGTLSTDAEHIKGLSGATFAQLLNSLVTLITGIIMSIAIVWRLGLVCTACVPILVGCGFLRVYLLGKIEEKSKNAYNRSAGYACEAVTAIRTVMSLTRETDVCEAYEENVRKQIVSDRLSTLQISIWYGFSQGLTLWVSALGFWYGSGQLKTHSMGLFGFYVAFTAVIFGAQTAGAVFSYAPDMGKAREAARSIVRLLDFKPVHDAYSKDGKRLDSVRGDIEFKDVHFRYPTRYEVPVLRGLNLSIKPGQYVALVGPSGCGKSTTIGLIERFYDPILGEISIDGINTAELNLSNYRSFISLVQQEPILYAGTLRENILMGLADGSTTCEHERVVEACRQANIHDFIMSLPDGYETFVGTKGTLLSGGQKQRVAIARALIRNPRILLLDEATSALDSESEKVVQAALDKAAQGRTTVAVAHRLSTIQNADMIYVFDGGVIVESGTHGDLLALNGRYSELVRMQALEEAK